MLCESSVPIALNYIVWLGRRAMVIVTLILLISSCRASGEVEDGSGKLSSGGAATGSSLSQRISEQVAGGVSQDSDNDEGEGGTQRHSGPEEVEPGEVETDVMSNIVAADSFLVHAAGLLDPNQSKVLYPFHSELGQYSLPALMNSVEVELKALFESTEFWMGDDGEAFLEVAGVRSPIRQSPVVSVTSLGEERYEIKMVLRSFEGIYSTDFVVYYLNGLISLLSVDVAEDS